jgi:hypothetical protein
MSFRTILEQMHTSVKSGIGVRGIPFFFNAWIALECLLKSGFLNLVDLLKMFQINFLRFGKLLCKFGYATDTFRTGPGLGGRTSPRRTYKSNGNVSFLIEVFTEEIAYGREFTAVAGEQAAMSLPDLSSDDWLSFFQL